MISKTIYKLCDTPELIENYNEAISDKEVVWEVHHRLETQFSDGTPRPFSSALSKAELIALGMYWKRPVCELIFLDKKSHAQLHKPYYKTNRDIKISNTLHGRSLSEDVKSKISNSLKGENNPFYGCHHTSESIEKIRNNNKGKKHTDEAKRKISESGKGRVSGMKGKHLSEESRKKISDSMKSKEHSRDEHGKFISYRRYI